MNNGMIALSVYAGLSGLILLWLNLNVGRMRLAEKVSIGDAGNIAVIRAMRGHANFIENVPMILILISLMAFNGAPVWLVHALAAMMVFGRLLHAWHFTQSDAPSWQRMYGYIFTTLSLLGAISGAMFFGIMGMIA